MKRTRPVRWFVTIETDTMLITSVTNDQLSMPMEDKCGPRETRGSGYSRQEAMVVARKWASKKKWF